VIKLRHEQELALLEELAFRDIENCSRDTNRRFAVAIVEGSSTIEKPPDAAVVRDPKLHPVPVLVTPLPEQGTADRGAVGLANQIEKIFDVQLFASLTAKETFHFG
jgi:hypothetical protein